jgi:hypothetical protein
MGRNDIRVHAVVRLPVRGEVATREVRARGAAGYLDLHIVGILSGLAPWIVYCVLVGNVPVAVAAVLALVVAVASIAVGRLARMSLQPLEIGAASTFLVLTVLTFALSAPVLERWLLP